MQNKKNSIQVWGERTLPQERWLIVCSKTTSNFSSISVITEIYRFKLVNLFCSSNFGRQTRQIFGLQNFGHVTGRPQPRSEQSIHEHSHCVQISALNVKCFFCYKRINKFSSSQTCRFLCFFVSQFMIT